MRPPFMHLQGQLPNGMHVLKDGRIAPVGMDINGAAADPRMNLQDMCNQGRLVGGQGKDESFSAFSLFLFSLDLLDIPSPSSLSLFLLPPPIYLACSWFHNTCP